MILKPAESPKCGHEQPMQSYSLPCPWPECAAGAKLGASGLLHLAVPRKLPAVSRIGSATAEPSFIELTFRRTRLQLGSTVTYTWELMP